ncbi:hypothetical protein P9294_gp036 [Bacillus phage FADO]|uniref:Uncharacterized protein n=1 Tax=Bacillus phage FADO TaxID=2917160 RepID=A0AAE9GA66_9CAUD|nr:hypothetical protein P9294_gp036 [Bacillus phage FADO]UNY48751.1 hypothetical protein fado_36 [Bacillus phage FADO]
MNIPTELFEEGGEKLDSYIKNEVEIERVNSKLKDVEEQIATAMIKIDGLINMYMPTDMMSSQYPHPRRVYEYDISRIFAGLDFSKERAINDFLAADEYFKMVRPLILERLALKKELEYLKKKSELIIKDEWKDWLHERD